MCRCKKRSSHMEQGEVRVCARRWRVKEARRLGTMRPRGEGHDVRRRHVRDSSSSPPRAFAASGVVFESGRQHQTGTRDGVPPRLYQTIHYSVPKYWDRQTLAICSQSSNFSRPGLFAKRRSVFTHYSLAPPNATSNRERKVSPTETVRISSVVSHSSVPVYD